MHQTQKKKISFGDMMNAKSNPSAQKALMNTVFQNWEIAKSISPQKNVWSLTEASEDLGLDGQLLGQTYLHLILNALNITFPEDKIFTREEIDSLLNNITQT